MREIWPCNIPIIDTWGKCGLATDQQLTHGGKVALQPTINWHMREIWPCNRPTIDTWGKFDLATDTPRRLATSSSLGATISQSQIKRRIWNMIVIAVLHLQCGFQWSTGAVVVVIGWQIYNCLCNLCLSPLKLWVRILLMVRCFRYNIMW